MEKEIGTLIKTYKGTRRTASGEIYDTILLVYRDKNGEKKTLFYDRPAIDYYTIKDRESVDAIHAPLYLSMDKVEKHTVYSDNLYRDIAANCGTLSFYDNVNYKFKDNPYKVNAELKNLFKSPLLYNADMDIEDYFIAKFYETHEVDPSYKTHKCYFDIENDTLHHVGFPDPAYAPCPISVVTLIDSKNSQSYTYILRNKNNPKLSEFETEIDDFKEYMHKKIIEVDQLDLNFNFKFFDDELTLIQEFFKLAHEIDPDYCTGWNVNYDIRTLLKRAELLYDLKKDKLTKSIYCVAADVSNDKYLVQKNSAGREFYLTPTAKYTLGKRNKVGLKMDSFLVVDGTNWMDQEDIYKMVHISGGKLDSYKLDFVAKTELKKEKLEYGVGETIKNQIYVNPRRHIEYNIRDVLLLLLIEEKTKDIDTVQKLSQITVTRTTKVFSKSIALTNFVKKYATSRSLVMATNKSKQRFSSENDLYDAKYLASQDIQEYDEKYITLFNRKDKAGAFVSNPLNNDYVGMSVFTNVLSMFLFEYVCDEDFSSLYPSIIKAFNLDPTNIIGKFYVIDDELKSKIKANHDCADMFKLPIKNKENCEEDEYGDDEEDDDDDEDSTEETLKDTAAQLETDDLCCVLADSIISHDWNMLGQNFFNLPSTEDMVNELKGRLH